MTGAGPDAEQPQLPGEPGFLTGSDQERQARRDLLAANLAVVERRIADACAAAGRPRDAVTLIVVTKTYPAEDTRLLASLGITDVAENRDQDAAPKAAECHDLGLAWHFVGQLQTNKVRSVLRYAARVHSIDRIRLVDALSAEVRKSGRPELGCLIQVALEGGSFDAAAHRGGARPDQLPALAEALAAAPGLRLDGVMAVAPITGPLAGDPSGAFGRLAEISSLLQREHPAATMVSAGMSGDLEQAILAGATHVRVGTAVLGVRPPLG